MEEVDLMEDALIEMREEVHRLMELHLEIMSYFTKMADEARVKRKQMKDEEGKSGPRALP